MGGRVRKFLSHIYPEGDICFETKIPRIVEVLTAATKGKQTHAGDL